jgi:hypothetical protein
MIVAMRNMPGRAVVACALLLAGAACSKPSGRGAVTYGASQAPLTSPGPPSPVPPTVNASDDRTTLGLNIAPSLASFTDGVAQAVVQSVDTARQTAVVIVRCGRTVSANSVIPPGFYWVDLHNAVFEMTSNPSDPSRGHVSDITFAEWAPLTATRHDWNVFVRREGTTVSDGPTYDICANAN